VSVSAQSPQSTESATLQIQKLDVAHLPNAIRLHPKVISGGQPEGSLGFRELQQLGVKTVISVDGAQPDVTTAKQFGMRYVHLPHGYDGISNERVQHLAKAVQDLDGPIYIHCHHGKHRSPAAATAACIANGFVDPASSASILEFAGTSPNYQGLYAAVAAVKRVTPNELAALECDFPESAKLPPMAEAMVRLEHTHDRLKQFSSNGWQPLPKHPDLDAAHEALLLTEHFTEMLRLPENKKYPPSFQSLLIESETQGKELDKAIRAWKQAGSPLPAPKTIRESFDALNRNCVACHRAHRD
jgi:protein tyrosine phosphatase (PTP) superfamily phosphohydrolase (DUF442 family)